MRFVEFSNLIIKYGGDGGSRVTVLQLGGKWMGKKVVLGLLLVGLEGSSEDILEARGT